MVVETPTSNPLPPPPPRRRSDGGSSARQENLSNADFRRMVMETPRRAPPDESSKEQRPKKKNADESAKRPPRKFRPPKPKDNEEEKKPTTIEDIDLPKYRDRAKERRKDQNPDYELMAATSGISSLHVVAPPGAVDLQAAEIQKKISIANSKYLGGDVEHTHLVKGLDYALLNKVRSEIDKKPEEFEQQAEEEIRVSKAEDKPIKFNSPAARVVYKWLVKPATSSKTNDMFLPGRMAFAFDMVCLQFIWWISKEFQEEMTRHIPTTVYRSKDDCPTPEEFVTVGVMVVLYRIAKIMAYLKLGASGKASKKKRRDKSDSKSTVKEEAAAPPVVVKQPAMSDGDEAKDIDNSAVEEEAPKARVVEDDIFADAGTEYVVTMNGSPRSEDMEESPRRDGNGGDSYFQEQRSHED